MAELLVSPFVESLIENLTSGVMREIGHLWKLEYVLENLKSTLTAVQAAVQDAEMQQRKTASLQDWLRKLKHTMYDVEDVLDMMEYENLRRRADSERGKSSLSSINPFRLRSRFKIVKRVETVRKRLLAIADERRSFHLTESVFRNRFGVITEYRQTCSLVNESEIYGRQEEKESILMKVLDINASGRDALSVLAICGMAGLGKTTLAQLVYNDGRMEKHFDLRMWVCVSDDFHVNRLVTRIIECVEGGPCNISEFDMLQRRLQERLMGKKFLLVLDDVWNENPRLWDGLGQILSCGLNGSVVLITTRIHNVATMMAASYVHDIGCLTEEHAWSLFEQRAFSSVNVDENLVPIGKWIVEKCRGVPLVIKAIGSMMRSLTSENEWWAVQKSEIWKLLDDENGVTPALRLSYYNLKPQLRQCFAYCCIFPKDYEMEEEHLIQLWVANGFIPQGDQRDLLSTGQSIFKELVWRSFFQEVKRNDSGNMTCKMHDLMHDLASSVMGDETYVVECGRETEIPKTPRHLSFAMWAFDDFSKSRLPTDDTLRSLIILLQSGSCDEDFISFLSKQQFLRALEVPMSSRVNFSKLFYKLKHLRHLVMPCYNVETLPNSLTSLYNLQTLKLMDSQGLLELPKDLRMMRKLWFLEMDSSKSLLCTPPGLGELTFLCRLSIFIVGQETSQQIHQLKELNLGGKLRIKGLDHLSNLEDAKSANLISKKDLTSLTLCWAKNEEMNEHGECFDEVLEGLQPHHNLERISIEHYPGFKLPNWLSSTVFTSLKEVSLDQCRSCVHLPPLGKLLSLTHMILKGFIYMKRLGVEWLGDVECPFPALTTLQIHEMPNLEDWSIPDSVRSFPRLTLLSIYFCPKLERLPSLPRLEDLSICHCNNITLLTSISVLTSLKFLEVRSSSTEISPERFLEVRYSSKLEAFPEDVSRLNFLESLKIYGFHNLGTFPAALLDGLSSLTSLSFGFCNKLLPLWGTLKQPPPLRVLKFEFLPELQGLPECMQQLTSLKELYIGYCDVSFLPTWFGSLKLLSTLRISGCKKLKSLPKSFSDLKSLRRLDLYSVSGELEERCKKADGEDWPQISHIPYISINRKVIQHVA